MKLGEVEAFVVKQVKEHIRTPASLFWTIGWPLFWLFMTIFIFLAGVPGQALPYVKGSATISMVSFGVATVGMVGLVATIAEDREKGLYLKLSSMPVSAWSEVIGRLFGSLIFGLIAIIAIMFVGIAVGSKFEAGVLEVVKASPFFLFLLLSAIGIGLVVVNLLKQVRSVMMVGIILLVAGAATSGLFTPYGMLPEVFRAFSRLYPISGSMHVIKYYLSPTDFRPEFTPTPYDFNPGELHYLVRVALISLITFATGVVFHSAMRKRRAKVS